MSFGAEVVYFRTHRQGISRFIQYADVYRQTVVVQSAATCGIGNIDILGGAFRYIPHFLLHTHRAGGIIHDEATAGVSLFQFLLRQ